MSLAAGARVGYYNIIAPLGAGGMGEVYRARDTKLKQEVALEVLPEAFARDPERMARFQREPEVLASLNHPNIAHIYGVEENALVMELVEGETLHGPLPLERCSSMQSRLPRRSSLCLCNPGIAAFFVYRPRAESARMEK